MIISSDTTWHTGDVIDLTEDIQIKHGVTVTVEPGVVINGNDNGIEVYGTFEALGSEEEKIIFKDVLVDFGDNFLTPGYIHVDHAKIVEGSFINGGYGFFDVSNSHFFSVSGFYIWYPTSDSTFSKNIFEKSAGLSVGVDSNGRLFVSNNVFAFPTTAYAIENWANYGDNLFITHNSFLNTDSIALSLGNGYNSAAIFAENNYFGTTDVATINDMIVDQLDSLSFSSVVDFEPFLQAPDPETPIFTLQDVNNIPEITSDNVFIVPENGIFATTIEATDEDNDTITYSIIDGYYEDLFVIDHATGGLSFVSDFDYENSSSYFIGIQADDGHGGKDTQELEITVTDVNEPLVIDSPTTVTVSENISDHEYTVYNTTVNDPENSWDIVYALDGIDAESFSINERFGQVFFITSPDYETKNSYSFDVIASDGENEAVQTVNLTVTDVNDSPNIIFDSEDEWNPFYVNVVENTNYVTTVKSVDDEDDPITYSIIDGEDKNLFVIDAISGELSTISAPDYESLSDPSDSYEIFVQADDGHGGLDAQWLLIGVTDVNEPHVIDSPETAAISENVSTDTVAYAASVSEPDIYLFSLPTYSLGGPDAESFSIDPNTGAVRFNSSPDYETKNSYSFDVIATDDEFESVQTVTLTVTDANDAPVILNEGIFYVWVGVPENTTAVTTIEAADIDGDILTYSIVDGADRTRFAVDPTTGALTFISAPDYEAPTTAYGSNVYEVVVQVDDGRGGLDAQVFAIGVTDVSNEAPVVESGPQPQPQPEPQPQPQPEPTPQPQPTPQPEPAPSLPPQDEWDSLPDSDGDAVPEAVEDLAPGVGGSAQGDGNGDGVQDAGQIGVTSVPFHNTGHATLESDAEQVFVTLAASASAQTMLRDVQQQDSPSDLPEGVDMPLGLIAFEADVAVGSTETFSLFVEAVDAFNGYYKQNSAGDWVNIATAITVGEKVRIDFAITDGGEFDADGIANGVIVDPGATAFASATPSQTLSEVLGVVAVLFDAAPGAIHLNGFLDSISEVYGVRELTRDLLKTDAFASVMNNQASDAQFVDFALQQLALEGNALATEYFDTRIQGGDARENIILEAVQYLLGDTVMSSLQPAAELLRNKVTVSQYASNILAMSDTDLASLQKILADVGANPVSNCIGALADNAIVTTLSSATSEITGTNGQEDVIICDVEAVLSGSGESDFSIGNFVAKEDRLVINVAAHETAPVTVTVDESKEQLCADFGLTAASQPCTLTLLGVTDVESIEFAFV